MITLRQLRYLDALAQTGHFGRAADACAISQPALSQQIAELEAGLGARLVERTPRGATLTEAGTAVVERAHAILAAVGDLESVARPGTSLAGVVRLGVIPTIAPYLLPRVLPALQAAYSDTQFRIRETVSAMLLAELGAGSLDVVIMALPVAAPGIETLPLFDDRFVFVAPAASAPAGPIAATGLDAYNLLLLEDGHCLRDQALDACGLADLDLRAQLGATSLSTIVQLVAAGLGCTLVPAMALDTLVADPRLTAIEFSAPAPSRCIGLAYRATTSRRAGFAALGEVVRAAMTR